MEKKKKSAYLLISHGTRDDGGRKSFFQFTKEFQRAFPNRWIQPAFLELAHPSIAEGIHACVRRGSTQIFILPLMLFPGRHLRKDIPTAIQTARRCFPDVDFHYAGPLALSAKPGRGRTIEPEMFRLILRKIKQIR